MHVKKASKPDGMAPLFFLTYWDIISQAEIDAILEALNFGVKIFQRAPSISHLLFTDDSVLFYKVNLVENRNIMSILEEYELASGQRINKAKASISFSKNVRTSDKSVIKAF